MDNFNLKKYLVENRITEKTNINKVYVILSRDQGLVSATLDPNKVEELIKEQEKFEEMDGGRPSVYVKEVTLE
jgi:hypothetical protein